LKNHKLNIIYIFKVTIINENEKTIKKRNRNAEVFKKIKHNT